MHNRSIKAMAMTFDGKTLYTVGYDRHLKQWKLIDEVEGQIVRFFGNRLLQVL